MWASLSALPSVRERRMTKHFLFLHAPRLPPPLRRRTLTFRPSPPLISPPLPPPHSHLLSFSCYVSHPPPLTFSLSLHPPISAAVHSISSLTAISVTPRRPSFSPRVFSSSSSSSSEANTKQDEPNLREESANGPPSSTLEVDEYPSGDFEYSEFGGWKKFVVKLRMLFAFPWERVRKGSVLTMKLRGQVTDQLKTRFSSGLSLPQICENFVKAAYDPRISGVYLHIEPLNCGWAKVEEIRRHIMNFRKSGLLSLDDLEEFAGDEGVEEMATMGGNDGVAATPSAGRDLPASDGAALPTHAGERPVLGLLLPAGEKDPGLSEKHRSGSGRGEHSRSRKRSGADGASKERGSHSKRRKAHVPLSEELAQMRARGSDLLRSRENLLELSYGELRLEIERGLSRADCCTAVMLEKIDRTERARLELAVSLQAAEEGKAGAVREREEVQVALEASVQAGDLMRGERDEAISRAEAAEKRLEAAERRLEATELQASEWKGAFDDAELALAEAKAALEKEVQTGRCFLESPPGKRELAAGQMEAHKRGVDLGQRQAIERYRHLHDDIQPFAPDYFPKAGGSSQRKGGEAATPARRGGA